MNRSSRVRLVVAGVSAALLSLVVATAALSDSINTDPIGDATGGAPDITQVVASNDVAGVITLRVTTVAPIVDASLVGIDLDTDSNQATGGGGAEYGLIAGTGGFGLLKWDGTNFVAATAPSLTMTRSGNVIEFRINRQDIGNVERFGFAAFTVIFDAADKYLGEDDAPDGGVYIYALALTQCANGKDDDGDGKIDGADLGCSSPADNNESDDPVTLKAGKPVALPAKARAGKLVIVGVPVVRVETGKPISSGTVKCAAKIGTKRLPGAGGVDTGFALCGFKVPVKAKGKVVRGTITVTVQGTRKVIPFSFKVT